MGSPQDHSSYSGDVGHYFSLAIHDKLLELNCCGTSEVLGGKNSTDQWIYDKYGQSWQFKSMASVSHLHMIGAPTAVSRGRLCTYSKMTLI